MISHQTLPLIIIESWNESSTIQKGSMYLPMNGEPNKHGQTSTLTHRETCREASCFNPQILFEDDENESGSTECAHHDLFIDQSPALSLLVEYFVTAE